MDAMPEYSLFHMRILEELGSKRGTVSYQDLCQSLCVRFDLVHLATLRSLLLYTACLDPTFPADSFKDRMGCSGEDQQSKKLMVAADIVTLFNLIQMNGGLAKDKLPVDHRRKFHKKQSCRSDAEVFKCNDRTCNLDTRSHHASQKTHYLKSDCNNCQKFIPTLGFTKDVKCRTASLNKPRLLPQYPSIRPECEMQSTYFPMDGESTVDQDSVTVSPCMKDVFVCSGEPFSVYSCAQKRDIFKENVHNLVAFSPHVITAKSSPNTKAGNNRRRELHKPPMFFNHSFEFPHSNACFKPISSINKLRVKHESLDDLQASTYFGPTTVSECVSARRTSSRHEKQAAWPVKSFSLNTEEGPDIQRPFFNGKVAKNSQHHNTADNDEQLQFAEETPTASPSGFSKTKVLTSVACGPSVEKRYKDTNVNCLTFQQDTADNYMSTGTQTEQSEHRTAKDHSSHSKYLERKLFKHSDEDSEVVCDDISDIFRFLDDMSVCDSVGIVQSSCCNSTDSLSQVTKSDGDASPEFNTIKLSKTGIKLDQLFQSLENSDDELKVSVYKLLLRTVEIEKKLESLSGVRGEISQVLSKLNKLDEKIQEPEPNGKPTEGSIEQIRTDTHLSPHVFQCHTTGHNVKVDKTPERCCLEVIGREKVKALQKSVITHRSSRPNGLTKENSITESKVSSITNSPQDWRTVSYSSHTGQEDKVRERPSEGQDRHRNPRETDQQHDVHHSSSQPPYQPEQVFSTHHFPPAGRSYVKGNRVCTDLRLTSQTDGKRSQPSWTTEEYKRTSGGKLSAVDLQVQESLNPNNLESWIEGIYTPAYNSLLKHREAEFRRARTCRIGALIAAAACTVLLVIIVPICTMKT